MLFPRACRPGLYQARPLYNEICINFLRRESEVGIIHRKPKTHSLQHHAFRARNSQESRTFLPCRNRQNLLGSSDESILPFFEFDRCILGRGCRRLTEARYCSCCRYVDDQTHIIKNNAVLDALAVRSHKMNRVRKTLTSPSP